MKVGLRVATLALGLVGTTCGGSLLAQQPQAGTGRITVDPAAASTLAAALRSAVTALPRDAQQADVEATLVFAIDQSGQPIEVVLAALAQVDTGGNLSPAARSALAAIMASRARVAQRGTGSIAGGPTIGLAFGAALSVTGGSNTGSSDYGN